MREYRKYDWQRITPLLGCGSNAALGKILGISASHAGRIVGGVSPLQEYQRDLLIQYARDQKCPTEVFGLLGATLPRGEEALENRGTEKAVEPVEFPAVDSSIWTWGLSFRNAPLLEELARHALRQGIPCRRVQDVLILGDVPGARKPTKADKEQHVLFPEPPFGLEGKIVLMLGSSSRHSESLKFLESFVGILRLDFELRQFEHPPRPAYFGYPTVAKFLRIGDTEIHPLRYVESTGATVMVDGGAIFSGPLDAHYQGSDSPYGQGLSNIVLVCALQRLSNGIAMRLLRDAVFRKELAPRYNPLSPTSQVLIFRATVVNDGYGTRIRKFEILHPK
jgi:hypothetical protein